MTPDSTIPTRSECEELVWQLEFADVWTAALAEIALKTSSVPWMQAIGEA